MGQMPEETKPVPPEEILIAQQKAVSDEINHLRSLECIHDQVGGPDGLQYGRALTAEREQTVYGWRKG